MSADGWAARIRTVGEAFLGVLRAELAGLAADLGRSGGQLLRALGILGAAFAVGFWSLGLLLYFAVELLALALPRWGAVGVVLAAFVLLAALLATAARRRIAAIESPAATIERRLEEHRRWWNERVAADPAAEVGPGEPGQEGK